jgi:Fe-S-cluster containining protein
MEPGAVIWIITFFFCIYVLFLREYFLARRKFKCKRCGQCCKLLVDLNEDDIRKIKKAGHADFISDKKCLKRVNGYCMFLVFRDGVSCCSIEDIKPKICRNFPNKKGIFGKKYDTRCKNFHYKVC